MAWALLGVRWYLRVCFFILFYWSIVAFPVVKKKKNKKKTACHCKRAKRRGFDPWVGKILWSRKWQSTPVLLPGKFHGQRSLVGYSPWGCKESGMTEQLSTHIIALQCCVRFYRTEKWVSDMYTYIPSSLDSLPVFTEHWVGVPVLWSRFSSVIYFMHSIVSMSIPVSQFIPPLPSLFVLYICVSISALQISSSVAFF